MMGIGDTYAYPVVSKYTQVTQPVADNTNRGLECK
jgi:hypothetical protein